MLWNYMRIYSNRKVENLEKLKALTYSLKKTEIPLYLGAHIFSCCFGRGGPKSYYFVSNFSLILPFSASWGLDQTLQTFCVGREVSLKQPRQ